MHVGNDDACRILSPDVAMLATIVRLDEAEAPLFVAMVQPGCIASFDDRISSSSAHLMPPYLTFYPVSRFLRGKKKKFLTAF